MFPRSAVVAVVCCCLLLTSPLVAVVGAQETNTTNGSTTGTAAETVDRCFIEEGAEFTIGTQGPEIKMVLHHSLFTNLGGAGALGVELSGSIGGPPIIELKTGVIFAGIDSVTEFLNNPFGAFSIAFDYQFELPMFGSGFNYNETNAPIDGPLGDSTCEFA